MTRLSVVDEIFLRTHRGLGTPIALQGLWRTADLVDPALLAQVHEAMRAGTLGRRVSRPRVPGARRSWQPNVRAYPIARAADILPVAELLDWADAQGDGLDPEYGPGWRLSTATLNDGGSLVSLTCSHVLADGRALAVAVDGALRGDRDRQLNFAALESDWCDAWHQWTIVLRGTAAALRQGIPRQPSAASRDEQPRTGYGTMAHSAILQCPAAEWDRAAVRHGGTANSLFIHLVATMLWNSGFPAETIEASLPVDTRTEPRVDNDLAMTEIAIRRSDTPATVRALARSAYERRMSAPGGMPEELLQVIPDRWAYALSKGAGERDILCSNIGTLPASLRTLGPHRCTGVAARAIHPGLTAARLPRTRLAGYLCRIGDDYVLSLVSLDPDRIESAAALRELAVRTAASARLRTRAW
ncbi:hypothetical protein OHA40_19875 [Nocardia sp. NBC_00508]|uniref:hypothetical protein n=1 Tax=Nocardia sp. NBC_00508 TaxID=2975992 RepID=UPI002E8069DE|nr:hypothetical protein [Nocardia sp. NBC_00508]WUD63991.1 hypothetical protein OHA40_19875 [Nocardia sp. NBC_00508]